MRSNCKRPIFEALFGQQARLLVFAIAALMMSSAQAEIYKYIDANGVVSYTNIKPSVKNYSIVNVKCGNCKWRSKVNWSNVPLNLDAYTDEILDACERHGLDESLVRAVIHAESSFRKDVVSDMGAQGLMQLMPATAQQYGVRRPFDAAENIAGGVAYLKYLTKLFRGDVKLIAAAYNAGEGAVQRHNGVPPYTETRNFVGRVQTLKERYARALRDIS